MATMTTQGVKQKKTSRLTYDELDDFRIILGHAGIPHELFRSPKGKLFIRFDRPIEGDSVALQFRKPYTNFADRSVRPAHYRMFIGVYDEETRQDVKTFDQLDDLVAFLGVDPESILAGRRDRSQLNRRLQATSVDELTKPSTDKANGSFVTYRPPSF
jgi:hypothetical protein